MENQIIPHVQGNVLSLAIKLQTETVTVDNGHVTKTYTDFVPNPNFPVTVLLASGLFSKKLTATMDGNVAHITDNGTLHIGKYSIEILCRDSYCNRMRFKKDAVVRVYDLTREADIPEGIEFSSETHWLTGAVFIAYGGSGGGGIAEETDPVFSASPAAGITQAIIAYWNAKQEAIGDLGQIRAGAAAGATALQPGALDGYATSDAVNRAIGRIQAAIDELMGADDVTVAINTFREIVAFLDSVENTETLAGIIAGLNTAIAAKYTKPETGIPASDLAQAVRNLLALAGTAVQPSALNGKMPLVVEITQTSNGGTVTCSANKTYAEIIAAVAAGRTVVAKSGHFVLPLVSADESEVVFASFPYYDEKHVFMYSIDEHNACFAYDYTLANVAFSGSYNDLDDTPDNLSDFNNDMGFARNIYGRLTNGSFYKGTYSGGQWRYEANAVTPATGVLYIDVADNVSYVWSGSTFVRIDEEPEQDLTVPVVTVSATGDVSQALNPNTFYKFGSVDSLDLTLVAGTGLVVYFGRFSTSANWGGTGLTVPNGVTEGANNPTVEASKTYEFNIMDNVLLLMEV